MIYLSLLWFMVLCACVLVCDKTGTLMTWCAIAGVTLTQRVKQSRASASFPSRSSCLPFWRLAWRRLATQTHTQTPVKGFVYLELCIASFSLTHSLSSSFLNFLLRWKVPSIKHQHRFNAIGQEHVHHLHTVQHVPIKTHTHKTNVCHSCTKLSDW